MCIEPNVVFKIVYPFLACFIPLITYEIYQEQIGKMSTVFSTLFFIFTSAVFYGLEPLSLNRQIIGELFFLTSFFLLINRTIPLVKRRLLLMIFGAALAVSHYTLAYIFLFIITFVFALSRIKPAFNTTLNITTFVFLFAVTFLWYTIGFGSPLESLINTVRITYIELVTGQIPHGAVTPSYLFFVPEAFTVATWFNLLVRGVANFFILFGVLVVLIRPKTTSIFALYRLLIIVAATILLASFIAPVFSAPINFTRVYGITLFFLSPAFVIGGKYFLAVIGKAWVKTKRFSIIRVESKIRNVDIGYLLIAIILSGYFLSQVGFVNYVTNSAIHCYSTDFTRMLTSNDKQIKFTLYTVYIPESDVFSACWLLNYKSETSSVFYDSLICHHVLVGYGLVPSFRLIPITNITIPKPSSLVYLGTFNLIEDVIVSYNGEPLNTSSLSFISNVSIVYSNGNSAILHANY
jgi:uncharacterized membrane protein